jgi:hypothetical protein
MSNEGTGVNVEPGSGSTIIGLPESEVKIFKHIQMLFFTP